jgi:WXG100 family type VII secretion target
MAIMNFNYERALRQAGQMDEAANEMENLANQKLRGAADHIAAVWQGAAATDYLRYCERIRNDIRVKADSLKETAERIRKAARILKEAEERALEEQRRRAIQ